MSRMLQPGASPTGRGLEQKTVPPPLSNPDAQSPVSSAAPSAEVVRRATPTIPETPPASHARRVIAGDDLTTAGTVNAPKTADTSRAVPAAEGKKPARRRVLIKSDTESKTKAPPLTRQQRDEADMRLEREERVADIADVMEVTPRQIDRVNTQRRRAARERGEPLPEQRPGKRITTPPGFREAIIKYFHTTDAQTLADRFGVPVTTVYGAARSLRREGLLKPKPRGAKERVSISPGEAQRRAAWTDSVVARELRRNPNISHTDLAQIVSDELRGEKVRSEAIRGVVTRLTGKRNGNGNGDTNGNH